MKTVRKTMFILSLLGLFIGMFSLVSCKKEKQYSCDQEIHNWAKENIDRFQEITREQLATLPVELAQAAYRTLTPEKKFEMWNDKFDIVYSQWDAPVREMIDEIKSHMSVSWFDPDLGAIDRDYIDSWENIMLTEWMDSTNYYLNFCMIHTEKELDTLAYSSGGNECAWANVPSELLEKYLPSRTPPGGDDGGVPCTCKWNSYCQHIGKGKCIGEDCNRTLEGCGVGWFDPCTKICMQVGDDTIIYY